MANPEHLEILRKGVETWNKWRVETAFDGTNLSKADLQGVNLSRALLFRVILDTANLREANLSGAELSKASLYEADLKGADLSGTDLSQAYLHGADLSEANLSRADLSEADLSLVDFSGADLDESDFYAAFMWGATFVNNDLSTVKDLDTVRNEGPSTIDVNTIYRSQGKIPEGFLRGVGVPDDLIVHLRSVDWKAGYHSCFISYSNDDQEFADSLYADLHSRGVRCWFAPRHVHAGRKLHEQIKREILRHERLLLILSPHSMKSEWVKTEIANARKREIQENKKVLFPVRLCSFEALRDWECFEPDTGKDSAREIREYFIPDFSNWRDQDSYQKAFERLLCDLKAEKTEGKTS
jgi:hypothetical protein